MIPQVGERWVRRGCDRSVLVVDVAHAGDRDGLTMTVGYRYVSGIGGSGLWKRGLTPRQTVDGKEWARLFVRPTAAITPPR